MRNTFIVVEKAVREGSTVCLPYQKATSQGDGSGAGVA